VIEAYIDQLRGALRGPRRATADLLAEARDSLVDAAEAYERDGLERPAAETRAVREFGDVRVVAPEYQNELGLAQARRTALLVLVVVPLQGITSEVAWRWMAPAVQWEPNRYYALLAHTVDRAGDLVIAAALLTVLATGFGARFPRVRAEVARLTGVFALGVYAFFAVTSVVLAVLSPVGRALLLTTPGALIGAVFWLVPASLVVSGRRCLSAA
jgi:hypothetical protein